MKLRNLLKPNTALNRAFVDLEHGMNDVLEEEFMLPPLPPQDADAGIEASGMETIDEIDRVVAEMVSDAAELPDALAETAQSGERITAHTQSRLAAFAAFDESYRATHADLTRIAESLTSIVAAHNLSREFVDDSHADILRCNELELQNAELGAANRRLTERLDKLDKQRMRYETLVEIQKRREIKLSQEAAALREELDATKLDLVETRNAATHAESQNGELQANLIAKTGMVERLVRENEMLREKSVNLTLFLDESEKKHTELRRKHDELSSVHAQESAEFADVVVKFEAAEREIERVQGRNDEVEARLSELTEQLHTVERDLVERKKRYEAENHALKGENQSLGARLQSVTAEHLAAISEIAAIKTRLSNLDSEKHLAEKKLATLVAQVEAGRDGMAAPEADPAVLAAHRSEVDGLKAEIAALKRSLKHAKAVEKVAAPAKRHARGKVVLPKTFADQARAKAEPKAMNGH